ncbi:glyoxalase [Knoellia sinensis KCTC 19936]|uniref:Glyoxalase n=1 Tax=Knoellia sinensis KCTC 19936 TaxID=1385520 RepID=A0A0A0JBI9_9MICO|nr:VOC family protein [Knoellia sinensis]KGN34174.1 glyoxalase [Knoellia sinensis KCTC 19936]
MGESVRATTVPILGCRDVDETVEFYEALGFHTTHRQVRPYPYVAVTGHGFDLHFSRVPSGADPENEDVGACLVLVDDVAGSHAALSASKRTAFGKVLAKGRPRITRYRPGASRFTLVDPSGNSLIFIQSDVEEAVDYRGAAGLTGVAKALDNARVLRDFKLDDRAALRAITSGLRRHSDSASPDDLEAARRMAAELEAVIGDE